MSLGCKNAVLSLFFLAPRHENLGTVQHFCVSGLQKCCTVPKFLFLDKKLGTVQHFCVSGLQKCCTVTFFWLFIEKYCTVTKNLKKLFPRTFRASQACRFWRVVFFFFFFFFLSTALFNPRPTILGTVQHVCSSGLQTCCTVPKFLVPRHKNLGTVQHFCVSGLQKCCTVPKIVGLGYMYIYIYIYTYVYLLGVGCGLGSQSSKNGFSDPKYYDPNGRWYLNPVGTWRLDTLNPYTQKP